MKVVLTETAIGDLVCIGKYIRSDNLARAPFIASATGPAIARTGCSANAGAGLSLFWAGRAPDMIVLDLNGPGPVAGMIPHDRPGASLREGTRREGSARGGLPPKA